MEHQLHLLAGARAPVEARHALAQVPGVGGELGYKALLLTSEMITVWVARSEHDPGGDIPVRVIVEPGTVRVEVVDEDAGDPPHVGGYSRRILDRLADRWGVERDDRAAIWFELDRRVATPALRGAGSGPGRSP